MGPAVFLASPASAYISGEILVVDGVSCRDLCSFSLTCGADPAGRYGQRTNLRNRMIIARES